MLVCQPTIRLLQIVIVEQTGPAIPHRWDPGQQFRSFMLDYRNTPEGGIQMGISYDVAHSMMSATRRFGVDWWVRTFDQGYQPNEVHAHEPMPKVIMEMYVPDGIFQPKYSIYLHISSIPIGFSREEPGD